jgi:hypothetical protein
MIRPTARAVLIFVCGIPFSLFVVIYDSNLWMLSLDYAALVLVTIGMDALLALSPRSLDTRIVTPDRLYIGERGSISAALSAPHYRRSVRVELIAEVRGDIEPPDCCGRILGRTASPDRSADGAATPRSHTRRADLEPLVRPVVARRAHQTRCRQSHH